MRGPPEVATATVTAITAASMRSSGPCVSMVYPGFTAAGATVIPVPRRAPRTSCSFSDPLWHLARPMAAKPLQSWTRSS